ncbi:hypothetical protein [Spiroplasma floricola]|uniref:Uncharacterized protein n=1 Tax=Spiroplasma floricola 23-6 TaxID=1336749 RepID=A0A2K8SEL9_9MOLU|nr:hypothetical protein [Spiroplasma floricola]AUB31896.1 hypothetical protein SFLOR_v1c08480 [Spiroplasma floricola 23-6]
MSEKKDLKNIYNYKPSNPDDPKIPSFDQELSNQYISSFDDSKFYFESSINKNIVENSKNDSEVLIEGLEDNKQNANSIIARIKEFNESKNSPKTQDDELVTNELIMPDPTSELNILNIIRNNKYRSMENIAKTRETIKKTRKEVRIKLTEKEIKKILSTFKIKVIKVTQKEVVLKNSKYGFEIFKNSSDNRYWVVASCFEEIWNPIKSTYSNLWNGNAFIGYGYNDFDEMIEKTKNLMIKGKTGNIIWRDFVIGWNKEKNRFYAADKPTQFTFAEYKKIVKWYKENKIRILVKQTKVKDIEDLMEENRLKRQKGEKLSGMSTIQAKLLDPPRRASLVFGYPVNNPKYKGKDFANPENKLYEIGFALTE